MPGPRAPKVFSWAQGPGPPEFFSWAHGPRAQGIALEGIDIGHPMDTQWTPNGRPNGRPMDACKKWGFGDSAFKEKVSTFDTLPFF